VQECRLMSRGGVDAEQWVADCLDVARRTAVPGS
jgi:hypothetical protein